MNQNKNSQDILLSPQSETLNKNDSSGEIFVEKIQRIIRSTTQLDISHGELEFVLKRHLTYDNSKISQKKYSFKSEQNLKLNRPPMGQSTFSHIWSFMLRLKSIMLKAYNRGELKLSQFHQLQPYFKLSEKQIKFMDCTDPIILQTLRYAIFNKQQIPASLVNVIDKMARTNIVKDWQFSFYIIYKAYMIKINCQQFQPPLDLYMEFVDSGLINPSQQELNEVFIRNQFLFKSLSDNKEFYSTLSQKKRLIYNQFPYLIEICDHIKNKNQNNNFGGLKPYLNTILNYLEFSNEDYLLDRYLPEVRCRYLKTKTHLTIYDYQFLFACLKTINNLSVDDIKSLYRTKPIKFYLLKEHDQKPCTSFWQIQQLCSNVLADQFFHLTPKQLQKMQELLDFQKCQPEDLIQMNLIFFILREEAYSCQEFPKILLQKISRIFKRIPDKKKKKQCSYIFLHYYFKLTRQNPEKRLKLTKQCSFPQQQLQIMLDEGRQLALNILLNEKDKILTFDENKCMQFAKIVKRLSKDTRNKAIKSNAVELYRKLKKINKVGNEEFSVFYEDNKLKDNQIIDLLQVEAKNGNQISVNNITNIIRILTQNNNSLVRKTCLSTLQHLVKNHNFGQHFPYKFSQNIIQLAINLYYEPNMAEQNKNQIIKLAVQCTYLPGTYGFIEALVKFLLQVYTRNSINSPLKINASFCIYSLSLNFKSYSRSYYQQAKQFLDNFTSKVLRTYKQDFQPTSKGSLNLLCAIVALAKNLILLPEELTQQLTVIGLKNRNLTQVALMGVLFYVKNYKSEPISQRSMMNICQILKQNKNNQIAGVYILETSYKKYKSLPSNIVAKIGEITRLKKCYNDSCQRLCEFFKNELQKN